MLTFNVRVTPALVRAAAPVEWVVLVWGTTLTVYVFNWLQSFLILLTSIARAILAPAWVAELVERVAPVWETIRTGYVFKSLCFGSSLISSLRVTLAPAWVAELVE